jgi:hypothetical protein
VLVEKGALFGGGVVVGGLAVLHLAFSDGPLRVFVAAQRLILEDIPGDVAVGVVAEDGVRVQAGLTHRNNAVKII